MKSNQIPYPLKFMIPVTIISLVTGIALLNTGSQLLFLKINDLVNPYLNTFFKYYTHLGDGIVFALVCLFFLFKKRKWFYLFGGTFLLSSLVSRICKDILFTHSPRPVKYFEMEGIVIQTIDGITTHQWSSFPSGHSITAFALCTLLAVFMHNSWLTILLSILAILAAFSRVYLAQHFVIDVLVGTWVGIFSAFIMIFVVNFRREKNKIKEAEKPLILLRL